MDVLINALSTNNLSGRHVLQGHLSQLATWSRGRHRFRVLHHSGNRRVRREMGENVDWLECPAYTSNWAGRSWWERRSLPRLCSEERADLMITLSGAVVPGLPVPQVSYAMNPEPMISGLKRGPAGTLKSSLQRWSYRQAMGNAALMVFISEHLKKLYRDQSGFQENDSRIVYAGIDEATFTTAAEGRGRIARKPLQLITVSVMAPHKKIETLLDVVDRLQRKKGVPARLLLIGPWPCPRYRRKIRRMIQSLKLTESVEIRGFVSRRELHRSYAESSLFCLLSRSESFGIPGLEAQAFGTPVIGSHCSAIPETCGQGGFYTPADDPAAACRAVAELLSDEVAWNALSSLARENASKYRWENCSRPFLAVLDRFAESAAC